MLCQQNVNFSKVLALVCKGQQLSSPFPGCSLIIKSFVLEFTYVYIQRVATPNKTIFDAVSAKCKHLKNLSVSLQGSIVFLSLSSLLLDYKNFSFKHFNTLMFSHTYRGQPLLIKQFLMLVSAKCKLLQSLSISLQGSLCSFSYLKPLVEDIFDRE